MEANISLITGTAVGTLLSILPNLFSEDVLSLLNKSTAVSLNKNKVPITLTRRIKLKLGDTFRFIIHHNIRHLNQIQNNITIQNSIQ